MAVEFVNLTPHFVKVREKTYFPSGAIARCQESWGSVDENGVMSGFHYHSPELPAPSEGVGYIVSLPVAQAAIDRNDVYIAAGQIRDESGRIIGCEGLAQVCQGGWPTRVSVRRKNDLSQWEGDFQFDEGGNYVG